MCFLSSIQEFKVVSLMYEDCSLPQHNLTKGIPSQDSPVYISLFILIHNHAPPPPPKHEELTPTLTQPSTQTEQFQVSQLYKQYVADIIHFHQVLATLLDYPSQEA